MTERQGSKRGRVIVAGGSIAGLFAGALLHRSGFAVEVFERSGEALASRGAGIVSHPELFDALGQAGAALDETVDVAWRGLIEERAMSAAARVVLCERLAFCLPPGEQMLGYPVPGADESVSPGG